MAGSNVTAAGGPEETQARAPTRTATGRGTRREGARPNVAQGTPENALVPTDCNALPAGRSGPRRALPPPLAVAGEAIQPWLRRRGRQRPKPAATSSATKGSSACAASGMFADLVDQRPSGRASGRFGAWGPRPAGELLRRSRGTRSIPV